MKITILPLFIRNFTLLNNNQTAITPCFPPAAFVISNCPARFYPVPVCWPPRLRLKSPFCCIISKGKNCLPRFRKKWKTYCYLNARTNNRALWNLIRNWEKNVLNGKNKYFFCSSLKFLGKFLLVNEADVSRVLFRKEPAHNVEIKLRQANGDSDKCED